MTVQAVVKKLIFLSRGSRQKGFFNRLLDRNDWTGLAGLALKKRMKEGPVSFSDVLIQLWYCTGSMKEG